MNPNPRIKTKINLLFPELSYKINGFMFKIHNQLGRFCKEKTYGNAIAGILKENQIDFEREKLINIKLDDFNLTKNWADFIIDGKILIEIKAKRFVTKNDYFQTKRYLEFLKLPLGIIVNFRQKILTPKRVLNSEVRNS